MAVAGTWLRRHAPQIRNRDNNGYQPVPRIRTDTNGNRTDPPRADRRTPTPHPARLFQSRNGCPSPSTTARAHAQFPVGFRSYPFAIRGEKRLSVVIQSVAATRAENRRRTPAGQATASPHAASAAAALSAPTAFPPATTGVYLSLIHI